MLKDKVQIIVKGEDQTNRIQDWVEKDDKVEITYLNGQKYRYNANNVRIKHSALSNDIASNCFDYLKRIADVAGLIDPRVGNILMNRYNKIDFVSEESMLSAFLTGKLNKKNQTNVAINIYPFGFNLSQKTAVENALTSPLTIIEGPPGTGKTQTILNIIANAVMRGESLAVVSSNNSATANILEKLKNHQLEFIAAYLGNNENKKEFIESQKPLPDLGKWELPPQNKTSTVQILSNLYTMLNAMLVKKNELSQLRQELEAVELEYKHFKEYCGIEDELPLLYLKHYTTSSAALKLWITCEKYIDRGKMLGLLGVFWRFINRILLGIINKIFYSFDMEIIIAICQKRWYMTRIAELATKVVSLQTELNQFGFDAKMKEYSTLSMQLFCD
jgi:DNA polymerase III delta prime subunit